jgi:hypothetical protein
MLNISKYLEKFVKKLNSENDNQERIIEIIKTKTGLSIQTGDIEIKGNIIKTKTTPAVKNKLFIYKEELLEEINLSSPIKIIDIT